MSICHHFKRAVSQKLIIALFVLLSSILSFSAFSQSNQTQQKQVTPANNDRIQSPKVLSFKFDQDRYDPSFEIVFDQPMVALGSNRTFSQKALIQFEPAVDCAWFWDDSKRLKCNLEDQSKLQLATRYQVAISDKLTNFKGQSIKRFDADFETERPFLVERYRSVFELKWLAPSIPSFEVAFNQPVALESLREAFNLKASTNNQAIALEISENTKRVENEKKYREYETIKHKYFIIKPKNALEPNASYHLSLAPGYRSINGALPGTKEFAKSFTTFAEFKFIGIECEESNHQGYRYVVSPPCGHKNEVSLFFSGKVDIHQTRKNLDGESHLTQFFERHFSHNYSKSNSKMKNVHVSRYSVSASKFAPVSNQVFNLTKAIVDQFGRPLSNPKTVEIAIGNAVEKLSIRPLTVKSDSAPSPAILTSIQTPTISSKSIVLTDNGAQQLNRTHTSDADKLNIEQQHELLPRELDNKPFLAHIRVNDVIRSVNYREGKVISTSFQITALRTKKGFDVSVLDIKSFEPIRNATVQLIDLKQTLNNVHNNSRQKQFVIAKARTQADGIANIKHRFDREHPFSNNTYAIVVTKGSKQARKVGFLPLESNLQTRLPDEWGDYFSHREDFEDYKQEYLIFGFTDKTLYTPGDTVRFKGYVRLRADNQLKLPKGLQSIAAEIESYDIPTIKTQAIELNEFGAFDYQIQLPINAPDDAYRVEITRVDNGESLGSFSFTVATIKPKEIDVQSELTSHITDQPVFGSEPAEIKINASYYSGGPVVGHDVKINVVLDEFEYTKIYPKFSEYTFDRGQGDYYEIIKLDKLVTDNMGSHSLKFQVPKVEQALGVLQIETAVKNSQGAWQAAPIQEKGFFNRKSFVGIKKEGWYQDINQDIQFSSIVVDYLGQPISDMPIQIELLYNEGDTNWTSIGTCTASIIDQQELLPSYTCPLRARHQGQYRLVAKINPTDETSYSSTINLFAYDFSGSSANDAQELKFRVEQASPLMQGEDNQLILISPFKRSRVLVAYGRSKQFKVQMVDMEEPVLKLPIKLRDIHTPAFDVTIVALDLSFVERDESKGVDLNTQVSKDQVVTLRKTFNVTEPENSSEIRLNTARKKYQPGEAVTLSLKSKKRKKLEYAIAVIDKAKLSYVDNYQDYYQPRQSELYTNLYFWDTIPSFNLIQHIGAEASIFHDVDRIMVTGSRINQSDLGPLLEDVNQNNKTPLNIRSLFKDSAAWHPSLVSDRKGKATFKFTLPDNLTTWAIFVVATDQKGQFYDQSMEIISSKDIEMRSQVPTQVVKGDQFNAQFSVINKTEETAVIQATIDRQQPSKILSTESLQLSPHQSAQIKAQIDVDSIETIKLVAHAHSHEHSDAIAAEIPVLDNIQFETIHKPFITHERLSVPVILPDTSVSDISELSISASTNSISQLKGALTYLRDYPHRCWEQQLSRAIGYAYHQQLQKRGFNLLEWEEGDLVNDTLNKSKLYQAPNGGFAFFTNENGRVSRYLSNFTATSFAWLQALGYQASEESMIELIRYQYQLINDFLRESGKREAKGKKIAPDTHYREEMSLLLASRARMAGMSSKNATQLEKPSTKSGSLDRKSRRKRSKFAKISKLNRVDKKAFVSIFAHLDKLSLSGLANLYHAALSFDVSKRPAILDAIKQKLPLSGEKLSLDNLIASGFFYGSTTSLCNTLSGMTAHSSTDEETNEQAQLEWQDRLRRTILGQKRPHGDFGSTQNNVWCIQAIVGNLEQSTQPNQLSIEFANQSHSLKVGKNESTHAFTAKLTPEPQSLHIKTEYKRPVFLDIALKYPIDTSVAKPSSHGMSIQRIYQVYRTSKWHEVTPDTRLAIGDWIKVSLKIYNPEYKRFIAVSDPNAGGLTPMSTSLLATVPGYITKDASYNSMFYQQQIAPTTSRFYADYLPKGHYQIDYFAQVTNQGRFSALPAIVEEMYDDDHKGRTAMQVLVVE